VIMTQYVERFNALDRVLHWIVAITFFLLLLSGIGLFAHTFFGYFRLFGGPHQGIMVHKWAGIVFFISSVLLFLRHLGETWRFDADDRRWIVKAGGYLSRKKQGIPQGKFNAGQKLFGLFAGLATIVMGLTGYIIWDPTAFTRELTQFSLMLHGAFFTLFMLAMVVHVYLATMGNPGTLEGMLWGHVTKAWAKKHASKWYAKMVKS